MADKICMETFANRPYALVTDSGETLVTAEEAEEAASADGYIILNWRERRPIFTGPNDIIYNHPNYLYSRNP